MAPYKRHMQHMQPHAAHAVVNSDQLILLLHKTANKYHQGRHKALWS